MVVIYHSVSVLWCVYCDKYHCDEWGGAESRGNGARPVELMIMSDTCTTHRSRVPRRSSGRIKGGATTVEDERGPGLDFNLCFVCGSRPWGAAALLLCLFICLLNYFKCSPVPASFFPIYELCYNHIVTLPTIPSPSYNLSCFQKRCLNIFEQNFADQKCH